MLKNQTDHSFESHSPLYCIVAKFKPCRFGSRNVFRDESQVPSPTLMVLELYELLPAGERLSWGAMEDFTVRRPRRSRLSKTAAVSGNQVFDYLGYRGRAGNMGIWYAVGFFCNWQLRANSLPGRRNFPREGCCRELENVGQGRRLRVKNSDSGKGTSDSMLRCVLSLDA